MALRDRLATIGQPRAGAAAEVVQDDNRRWASRKQRNTPASILFDGITTPIPCTVKDTSSTGALIEMVADKFNSEGTSKNVEDHFHLIITLDKTYVYCKVAWRRGSRMGVRFMGPVNPMPKAEANRPSPFRKKP